MPRAPEISPYPLLYLEESQWPLSQDSRLRDQISRAESDADMAATPSKLTAGFDLASSIADLRGETPLRVYSGASPSMNAVDIFRCAITEELAKIADLDTSLIYPALEWTSTLDKGDLLLAVPRLRVKGSPTEKAASWAAAVSRSIQSL